MHMYEKTLLIALKGKNPWYLLIGVVLLFFASIMMIGLVKPQVRFFPDNKPGYIYVFIKLPEGTDQRVTDSVTHLVERKVHSILGEKNPIVESVITNVGLGAGESMFDRSVSSNKGKITVNFRTTFGHGSCTCTKKRFLSP